MNPNDPKTWPPTVWCLHGYKPKRPERDEHWLSKALAAEMRERGIPRLDTQGDLFWAAVWCCQKLGASCSAFFEPGDRIEIRPGVGCPTGELGALWLALNERAAERFHVDVHGFAPLRLVVGGAR